MNFGKIFLEILFDKKSKIDYICWCGKFTNEGGFMKSSEKGMCKYMKIFYGWITVSDKGQIALPKEAREDLNIKTGEKLLVVARKDRKGESLLKQML